MRFVVAPQEFKGSLTAVEAAHAIAEGIRTACPDAFVDEAPMSDGGPGMVDALLAAAGGQRVETAVHDPLMRPLRAAWGLLEDGTAAIEMAAASGLVLLRPEERDPLVATTCGTGELIASALDRGCRRLIVGVGGSATVDGGAGAMQALGARLLDPSGADLAPGGAALARLDRIDISGRDPRLAGATMIVASDVTNVLYGPEGAAAVFGPQKGATPDAVRALDAALRRFASVVRRDLGADVAWVPGSGAAGGLGAGLVALARASIEPGFPLVANAARLEERIAAADVVITGEGRLDAQTAYGKSAFGVARLARAQGKRIVAICGSIEQGLDTSEWLDGAVALADPDTPVAAAMARAGDLLRSAASEVAAGVCVDGSDRG
ncbi:MAG: glycerate kinase [Dehalococcoidia bacterium]